MKRLVWEDCFRSVLACRYPGLLFVGKAVFERLGIPNAFQRAAAARASFSTSLANTLGRTFAIQLPILKSVVFLRLTSFVITDIAELEQLGPLPSEDEAEVTQLNESRRFTEPLQSQ